MRRYIFLIPLAINFFLVSFVFAQESLILNSPSSGCQGSLPFVNLTWSSNISGNPIYYVLRKIEGGTGNFEEIGSTKELFFKDSTIRSDKNYVYKIKAVKGSNIFYSNEETSTAPYCPPVLSPPISFCDSQGPHIKLEWTAVSGDLLTYEIYRNEEKIAQTIQTEFIDGPNIEGTKAYYYFVKAIWKDGKSSSSNEISIEVPACPPSLNLSQECNLDSPGGPKILLSWNNLLGVQKYQIYRKAQTETEFSLLSETSSNVFEDNLVKTLSDSYWKAGTISYFVKAVWEGDQKDSQIKQINATSCPPFLKVESNCQEFSFRLSWTATLGATKYNIYREGKFLLQKIGITNTSFIDGLDENVCPGKVCSFTYKVIAIDSGVNLSSNEVTQSIDCTSVIPPSPPPQLDTPQAYCLNGDSRIFLNWTPSNNVNYYSVVRNGEGIIGLYETSFEDSGVEGGYEYTYHIEAVGLGTSTISNSQTIIAFNCSPPSTPILVLSSDCEKGSPFVLLSWSSTTNTFSFDIYRGTSPNNLSLLITFPSNSLEFNTRTWKDTNVSSSTTYYYQIIAKGPPGVSSSPSSIGTILTPSCLPSAPTFSLSSSCVSQNPVVNVYWTMASSKTTSHYEIYREDYSTNVPIYSTYNLSVTSWQDTSVEPEKTYRYKVEAVGYGTNPPRASQGYKSITTSYCLPPDPFTLQEPNIYCQGSYSKAQLNWTQSNHSLYYQLYRYGENPEIFDTIYSTSFTDFGLGYALSFDGSDYVEMGNPEIPLTGDLTIEFWTKPTNLSDRQNIICKAYGAEFCLVLEAGGGLSYYHGSCGGMCWPYFGFYTSNVFSNNKWTHIVITRDLSSRTVKIYKDGNLINSAIWSQDSDPVRSSYTLKIGRGYVKDFQGIIDEVRLYNRVLSNTEVQEHSQGIYNNESNLISLWHFDEGQGQFVSDSSNYGINGRLGSSSDIDGNDPQWIKNGLYPNLQYYWRVKAINDGGSTWSNTTTNYTILSCVPTKPGLVLTTFCDETTGSPAVSLRWSFSFDTLYYEIYRQGGGLLRTIGQSTDPSKRIFINYNLEPNATYAFWVKAVGPGGNAESDHLSIVTPSCIPPTPPQNLTATFECDGPNPRVKLTFEDSQDASYYRIFRNDGFISDPISDTDSVFYTYYDNEVRTNKTYIYRAKAFGPGGESDFSNSATITTSFCIPSTPSINFLIGGCENQSPFNTIYWSDPDFDARVIFYDDFESGDFSKWSGIFENDGTTSVESLDPHWGRYHSQFVLNPINNWDGYGGSYFNIPGDYTSLYLRAYYKFDTLPANGYGFWFGSMLTDWWEDRSSIGLVNQGGQYSWALYFNNTTTYSAPFTPQTNKWYSIELYTKVGTIEGEARVWIDGELKATITNRDVSRDSRISQVRAFVYVSGPPGTKRTFKIDSVFVSDKYIGPEIPIYNATEYRIYRNTIDNASSAQLIKTVTQSEEEFLKREWKDTTNLENNKTYFYWLKSAGPAGESSFSPSRSITTLICVPPPAPILSLENLYCKDNIPFATFNWTTSTQAYSYNLYRRNPNNSTSVYSTRIPSFTDKGDYALEFDGENDYVRIENSPSLNEFDSGLAVEIWAKQTKSSASDAWAVDKDYTGYRIFGNNKLQFCIRTPTQSWICGGGKNVTFNQWYHLVGVVDNVNLKLYFYINGQLDSIVSLPEKYNFSNFDLPLIFGRHNTQRRYWPGIIDEVRIYGRALAKEEVQEHYLGIYKNEAELRGAWHFDEGSGIEVFDSSGKRNHGIIAGPNWVEGKINNSLEFGGLEGYVLKYPFYIPTDQISVEFWIKTSDTQKEGTPFSYAVSGQSNEFLILDYRKFSIFVKGSSVSTGIGVNDGNWHHVVVTWRSSDGRVKLYKDGNGVYSGTLKRGAFLSPGGALTLGQEQDCVNGCFDLNQAFLGFLDEVRIYNRVLDDNEVKDHYNGIFNNETGLILLWHFNESEGNVAFDESPLGNDGTIIRGPEWKRPSDAPFNIYVEPLEGGKEYRYYAKAFGAFTESTPSNEILVNVPSCLPAKPDLKITFQCELNAPQLKLEWPLDPNTQYWDIYKRREGKSWDFLAKTTKNSYIDENVETGITYEYYLIAVGKGVSTVSDVVSTTVGFCYPPPYGGNSFDITLATSTCYGYSSRNIIEWPPDPTHNTLSYNIWRKNITLGEADFSLIQTGLTSNTLSFFDSAVSGEEKYIYKIEALGSGEGNSVFSNISSEILTLNCNAIPPNPPDLKVIDVESTGDLRAVYLFWTDAGNEEYYKIWRVPPSQTIATTTGYATPTDVYWIDSSQERELKDDQTYYYMVVAVNKNGETESNEVEVYVPIAKPGKFTLSGDWIGGKIYLSWTEAATTEKGGTVKYTIERDSDPSFSSPTEICSETTSTECYDENPSFSEFYYRAKATNNGGSTYSNTITLRIPLVRWREIGPF